MNKRLLTLVAIVAIGVVSLWAQERGYVLKRGDGEKLFDGAFIVKASTRTGSQGGAMVWSTMPSGQSTGLHVHHRADEFFYVISGAGVAFVGNKEVPIEAGDVVFVPKGQEHRLKAAATGPLETVFVVDKSGLDDEFRENDVQARLKKRDLTLQELNKISQKHGTTYKTLQ